MLLQKKINKSVKSIHLLMRNKYGLKNARRLRTHFVQENIENENEEIRADTRIKTYTK